MVVLVTGSRDWTNWSLIWGHLRGLGPNTVIVHGDARGADKMAGYVADKLGYEVRKYPADWNTHGKAAGPIRNRHMFNTERPELVLAFKNGLNDDIRRYMAGERGLGGTVDMVCYARSQGCPVNVVEETEKLPRFEAHITVDREFGRVTEEVGQEHGWVFSQISGCPILGQGTYCYLTNYDKDEKALLANMDNVAIQLSRRSVPVLRLKIEQIRYDTKTGIDVIHA